LVESTSGADLGAIPGNVHRLHLEFESGLTRSLVWRRDQLGRLCAMLRENADSIIDALAADLGKPMLEGWAADVGHVLIEARLALRSLERWARPESVLRLPILGRARVIREPLGVVLIIAPWNYPVSLVLVPLVSAIAAGNAAVLKPSELAPRSAAVIAALVSEYLDSSAFLVVEGGVEQTTLLLEQPFDHIFYTGSARVGRIVMQAAARNLTPVTLELGGKSPCIVDQSANVRNAARRIAWGKFLNAGQTCIAPDYVLVHERLELELIKELEAAITSFYGEDPSCSPDYARIVDRHHCDRLSALMDDGEIAIGGVVDPARGYVSPTVLRSVSADSAIMQQEIFGPLLPILTFKDIDEAVDFVSDREKPLALYLFSDDEDVHEFVLASTNSGGICINDTLLQVMLPGLPFGGIGPSGMGSYHGRNGFETFSHRRALVTRGNRFNLGFLYPPYSARMARWLRRIV